MVALRSVVCSGRWEEAWPQISVRLREDAKARSAARRDERRAVDAARIAVAAVVIAAVEATLEAATLVAILLPPPTVARVEVQGSVVRR